MDYRITIDLDNVGVGDATDLGDWIWREHADAFDANRGDFRLNSTWEGNQDATSGRITVELIDVAEGDATDLAQQICDHNADAKVSISADGFPIEWEAN